MISERNDRNRISLKRVFYIAVRHLIFTRSTWAPDLLSVPNRTRAKHEVARRGEREIQ